MAGQYNGLADLLLAATRALDTTQNATSIATVPCMRIAPTKRWSAEDSSSSGSGSESDSATPMARKRAGSRARHPYRRSKVDSPTHESEDEDRRKPLRGPAQHNEVEKRRRAYLSSCYIDLKMLVPSIATVKASNVTILQTAAGHVQELDASAKKLATQLRAAKRRREQLETQVATLRAQHRLAAKAAWSPPSVGDSSGYESCGMDDEGTSSLVPDTLSAVVDDARAVLPTFGDAAACMSTPMWAGKVMKVGPMATPSGIDLLMLLAASAGAECGGGGGVDDADAQGGRRHARKPARFL